MGFEYLPATVASLNILPTFFSIFGIGCSVFQADLKHAMWYILFNITVWDCTIVLGQAKAVRSAEPGLSDRSRAQGDLEPGAMML